LKTFCYYRASGIKITKLNVLLDSGQIHNDNFKQDCFDYEEKESEKDTGHFN
jgi:hypothetical protein